MSPYPNLSSKFSRGRLAAAAAIAACLAVPAASWAQTPTPAPTQPATVHPYHHRPAARTAMTPRETVEDRITMLHARLMITAAEEPDWTAVAQAMRENEATMRKLTSARRSESGHEQTAVEDLRTYERFTQAHVDGLKALISSFETLYVSMPAPQQAVADHVFKSFGHRDHMMKS